MTAPASDDHDGVLFANIEGVAPGRSRRTAPRPSTRPGQHSLSLRSENSGDAMGCDGDPREETQDIEPASWASAQRVSRVILATALGALGLWIVHRFLPALAW